ncbi:ABC1 kinase family protein [Methylocapsa acidiphila]|uniref:ABC1 kinase family protein n=1 Tax=Methylocapsa acidiphila TaxID=133552 RepID=UPI0003FB1F34|nr:AarF/ABC1/UbiB kinase family protein [Methylocapsa acidiphila]
MKDDEGNRFSARAARYARVGANVGGAAARIAGARLLGAGDAQSGNAAALARALGGLKGPMMKVAQMMATIPDLLPAEYADEFLKLQCEAPPMGAAFVKRRMQAELGPDWRSRFGAFDHHPAAAASLGQVHRASGADGAPLACKLQYPDMSSAVEADLSQLGVLFALHRRMNPAIDTREVAEEIADRIREELDYAREAKHAALYRRILAPFEEIRVPSVRLELSTARLLTMDWLEGEKLPSFEQAEESARNDIARAIFKAWWVPFSRFGVIHGDPHLGNYTVITASNGSDKDARAIGGINLLDYGCIRIFSPKFVGGVIDLYEGLLHDDFARVMHAYETWGFQNLSRELAEILNVWARFIYAPLLEDRVRTVADGVAPGQYGRREAFQVHQALKKKGPVRAPREFVFMDRAAIGLGGAFLRLDARLNFHRLFNETIGAFSQEALTERQSAALVAEGLDLPA